MKAELLKSRTFSISIAAAPQAVYEFVSNPANLPRWAWAFCKSIRQENGQWVIQTDMGAMTFRVAPANDYGVLDHFVSPSPDFEIYVPMRVIANGPHASEVIFTLFQQPGMSDGQFKTDAGLVEKDLAGLKKVMESFAAGLSQAEKKS